ncbi:MAG: hypothetical protein AAGE93_19450 [Bacteroidota bacterium]
MNKKLISIFYIVVFISQTGIACSCSTVSIDSAFKHSSVIFKGRVEKIIHNQYFHYQGYTASLVTFKVTEAFKKVKEGGGPLSLIDYHNSCSFQFEENKEYYVFASDLGYGHYSTSICNKTSMVENFEPSALKRLKELSDQYVDDLNNYRDLLVMEKTAFNALTNENEIHAKTISDQQIRMKVLIYLVGGLILVLTTYILILKRKIQRLVRRKTRD